MRFDGSNYVPTRDDPRLVPQHIRIYLLMKDNAWRSLQEIAVLTGTPEASVSAQLRHLRKERFGGHTINKRLRGNSTGTWEYQLIENEAHNERQTG